MSTNRQYSGKRYAIIESLAAALTRIDGTSPYWTNLENRVEPRLRFWDEINEFPCINLNGGTETREYQGGGFKDRRFYVTIRCYVNEEDAYKALDLLLEDVENVIEDRSRLEYSDSNGNVCHTYNMTIVSIDTDEGVLEPLGVGEILVEVLY